MTRNASPVLERKGIHGTVPFPRYSLWVKNSTDISDRSYTDSFIVILGMDNSLAETKLTILRLEQRVQVAESVALEVLEHYASLFKEDYGIDTEIKRI
jgi:hypothetical protein